MKIHTKPTSGGSHRTTRSVLVPAVVVAMSALTSPAQAAGFSVQQVKAPGAAMRMSTAGYLTGTYEVKCSKLGGQPPRRICYYAPWIYDGKSITKVQWPVDWNYVYSFGINDSLDLVGREYRGSLTAGGWLYSGGVVTYSGSLPAGGGSVLAAINNRGVAIGTGQSSLRISRAVTFQVNGGPALAELPAFPATVPTTGADINDEGGVAGSYTENDGSVHAYAYMYGTTTAIPDLPGARYCQASRISQLGGNGQVWVAGNCGDRGFLYQLGGDGQTIELRNLDGLSGGVSVLSVNSRGDAVGTVAGKAVTWTAGTNTAVDLNRFAPRNVSFSRGTDINDSGTVLAGDVDSSGNISTYLLTPTP